MTSRRITREAARIWVRGSRDSIQQPRSNDAPLGLRSQLETWRRGHGSFRIERIDTSARPARRSASVDPLVR
jgi:hypothetical protein